MSLLWKPFSKSMRVLNRLNSNKRDKEDTLNQDMIRSLASNHEQVQQRIFTKWINMQLEGTGIKITSVEKDLRDGHALHALLKQLTNFPIQDIDKRNTRFHQLSNVSICLEFLENNLGELSNIGSIDIVDGNLKLTLGLLWLIILRFQIQQVISFEDVSIPNSPLSTEGSPGIQALQSSDSLAPHNRTGSSANIISKNTGKAGDPKKFLLEWVQGQLRRYEGLIPQVRDFNCSWQSGLAFAGLIHRHDSTLVPNLGDMVERVSRDRDEWRDVLDTSFRIAKEGMGIASLLEPDDILSASIPDEKIIMMYVSEFYKVMSAKQAREDYQEQLHLEGLVSQFMQLSASISTQIEKFYTAFDNTSFDYSTASPKQLEEFSHIQRQRSKSLNDYEPTVETLDKSAYNILSTETSLDPELKTSVTQSRDQILSRWNSLQEILAENERKLDEIQIWGELNHRITQLDERLKNLGSLCSDFLELKNSLDEKERRERLEALKTATLEGADQLKKLKLTAGSTAPPHIHQRLNRCGELIDIAQLNIQRFHVSLQVDDFTNYLADALVKLSHKRAELRKLVKASTWTPESQNYEEVKEQRDGQLQWKDTEGEALVTEVKVKCTTIRQTIGDAPFEQSAQLELVLRKENEIMGSWKEIERILSVQELLMQQSTSVETLAAKIKTVQLSVDQLQKESDAQDFEIFEAHADQCLDNIETLHDERQRLPFPQLPETMGSDDFIANYISNHLDVLTQRLMTLRSGRETHQEEDQLFELFSSIQMEGDELAASADQHMAWIEGNLGLLAKVTHPDAPTLFDQISAKKEELEAQNVRLEEQRQALSQRIASLLPQIKPKSQIDQLQTIQSQMDAQRESIESLTFKLVEILGVGQHMLSRIAFFLKLQSNISALRKELSSCRPAHATQDALLAWSQRLEELDNTRSVPFPTCNNVAFSHITQLNDYLTACIRSTDSAIAKATQELASLETQVQNQPFEQFLKQADDFISACKSLINITKKTLTTYQLKSTDDSQVITAKSSALSMFVTSLQEKSAALQADHVLLKTQFEILKEQSSNSRHSASISKRSELDSAWKEFLVTIDSVPIIHQQVQELTARFSQLHQVDSTIQQTRSDIIDLLNANVEDMDSQINLLKEMLSKISLLLGRVAVYESPELSPQTPSDIAQVLMINRQALKELIRQIDASLSATQLLFITNCEKAQNHQNQAVNCSQWEAWCRQQGELLEDEQRLLRSTLWKDASTSGLELLSKARATRIQLQNKLAQNQMQFEATIEPLDSTAENSARTAFKDLSSAITFQLAAIPKVMALSSHWALVQQAQHSISHHKGLLSRKPIHSSDLDVIRSAIEDDSSELSQAYIAYNASVSDFTELSQSLDNSNDNIFLFVDPLRLEELVQASLAIPVNWEQLKRLANEMRDLLQASDMCRIIHERIELLHGKVNAIKVTGQSKKATELAQIQLSDIDYELKDKVLAQIRQWQNLVFSLPRDNANWSGKVKLTGEMIDLVTRAIDEKQHRLSTHQDQVQLLALCDEIDQKVGNYLATIDAITKDVEKSSTFLADLEKAATRLASAKDAATTFIDDGLDKVEGASCIGDWQLEERAQVLPAQWDEVRRMGAELQAKLDKRIGLKQDAMQAQSVKRVQRAKLRAPLKYIPPNKDTVKSRYMIGVAEKKEKTESPKAKPSPNVYVADMKDALDVEVARIVNSYPQVVKVIRDNETGKYWIGEKDPKLCFCRVLRSNLVMVRIGGGWSELSKYIADHAVDNPDYRSMSRSQSRTPSRAGSSLGTIYERNNFKSPSPSFGRRTMSPVSFSPRPGRVLSPLSGLHDSSRLSGNMASMSNFGEVHSRSATPSLPSEPSFARHTVSSLSKSRPISRCESPSAQGASSPNSIIMSPKSLSSPLAPRSPLTSAKKLPSTISKAGTSPSNKPLP